MCGLEPGQTLWRDPPWTEATLANRVPVVVVLSIASPTKKAFFACERFLQNALTHLSLPCTGTLRSLCTPPLPRSRLSPQIDNLALQKGVWLVGCFLCCCSALTSLHVRHFLERESLLNEPCHATFSHQECIQKHTRMPQRKM